MREDLTGRKFGRLTVLGPGERNSKGRYRWKCECECGRIINTYACSLISGHTKSCGECVIRKGKPIDITGMRFGRLVAIREVDDPRKDTYWLCECDCGNTIIVTSSSLRNGNTRSCGCLHRDRLAAMDRSKISHKKHGAFDKYGHGERLYDVWRGMKRRCNNPNSDSYKYYGERGIRICEEWLHDYAAFREWALNNGYNDKAKHGECTLDRINNNEGYSPANCRFVSMAVQNMNKRKRGTCFLEEE